MIFTFRKIAGFGLAFLLLACSLMGATSCKNVDSQEQKDLSLTYEQKDFSLRIYNDAESVNTETSKNYRASTAVFGQSGYSTYNKRAIFSLLAKVDSDKASQIEEITYLSNQSNVSIALRNESDGTSQVLKRTLDSEVKITVENPRKMTKLWIAIDYSGDFYQFAEKHKEANNSSGWMLELLEEDFLTVQVEFKDGKKLEKSYTLKPVPLDWKNEEGFTFLIAEQSL